MMDKGVALRLAPSDFCFLGEGQNGIALRLTFDDAATAAEKSIAVKLTRVTSADQTSMREALIGIELNTLKPRTQAFITTQGFFYSDVGIPLDWLARFPRRREDGADIDWQHYHQQGRGKLLFIFMEYGSLRIGGFGPATSAPCGRLFYEHFKADDARDVSTVKKLLFVLLHALYVARKTLMFSHNDVHDGQVLLFKRLRSEEPVVLGARGRYVLRDLEFVPKFIDFGASITGRPCVAGADGNCFSDDVGQLVAMFHRLVPQDALMEQWEFEEAAGSSRNDAQVVRQLLDCEYFAEFHRTGATNENRRNKYAQVCIGCMAPARYTVDSAAQAAESTIHVCGIKCAQRTLKTLL